jgi:dihydrofolate synthase / folylpolyglutamate synthase
VDGSPSLEIVDRASAVAFLDARIGQGVKPGLERITGLLTFMGNPETSIPSIHIAGTNGKTTVARMVQQILGAHGLSVGGFTSPHLARVEERFSIHGEPVSEETFTTAVRDIAWFVVGYEEAADVAVTYFEVTAALAFSLFADATVDAAVVEVGLGGRLDATNVLDADVSIVTGIDIDHVEYLGPTIAGIAAEKVAILKPGGTLVTGPLPDEAIPSIEARVAATDATWLRRGRDFDVADAMVAVGGWLCSIDGVRDSYEEVFLPLHGRHQVDHLATAIAASEMFLGHSLDTDSLELAVASMTSPGRLEVVARRPIVLIDGAHNRQGFDGLALALDEEFPAMQWQLVLGVRGERSVDELVEPLSGAIAAVFATQAADPGSIDRTAVALAAASVLGVDATPVADVASAVEAAVAAAGPEGGVVVAGSLYVAGEARSGFAVPSDRTAGAHLRFEAERAGDLEEEEDLPLG